MACSPGVFQYPQVILGTLLDGESFGHELSRPKLPLLEAPPEIVELRFKLGRVPECPATAIIEIGNARRWNFGRAPFEPARIHPFPRFPRENRNVAREAFLAGRSLGFVLNQ